MEASTSGSGCFNTGLVHLATPNTPIPYRDIQLFNPLTNTHGRYNSHYCWEKDCPTLFCLVVKSIYITLSTLTSAVDPLNVNIRPAARVVLHLKQHTVLQSHNLFVQIT